jgi:hypothetical protein
MYRRYKFKKKFYILPNQQINSKPGNCLPLPIQLDCSIQAKRASLKRIVYKNKIAFYKGIYKKIKFYAMFPEYWNSNCLV